MLVHERMYDIMRSLLEVLLGHVAAEVDDSGLEVDVEEVLGGDEVGRGPGELQRHVLLVGLLLGEGLHLVAHLLVAAEEVVQLLLLASDLVGSVGVLVGLQLEGGLVVDLEVVEREGEGGLRGESST
jgi:hypothetical protein